jgi:hypothetical protein
MGVVRVRVLRRAQFVGTGKSGCGEILTSHWRRSATLPQGPYIPHCMLEIICYIHANRLRRPFPLTVHHHGRRILLLHLDKMAERTRTKDSTDVFDTIFVAAPGQRFSWMKMGPAPQKDASTSCNILNPETVISFWYHNLRSSTQTILFAG